MKRKDNAEIVGESFVRDGYHKILMCVLKVKVPGEEDQFLKAEVNLTHGPDPEKAARELAMMQFDRAYPEEQAPRITETQMRERIVKTDFVVPTPTLTICIITLNNGYVITGESACVSPENYDQKKGEDIAYKKAFEKLWPLFGFMLAEDLHRGKVASTLNKIA